jgi:hypothetical protein
MRLHIGLENVDDLKSDRTKRYGHMPDAAKASGASSPADRPAGDFSVVRGCHRLFAERLFWTLTTRSP